MPHRNKKTVSFSEPVEDKRSYHEESHEEDNYEQENEQLMNVTSTLERLNSVLPEDRHIRLIMFLFSRFSPKSSQLIELIPDNCKKYFYFLCIDNSVVRRKIMNSSSVKVSKVPCIIVIHKDGVISTYEGDGAGEIVKTVFDLNINLEKKLSLPSTHEEEDPTETTPLSHLFSGSQDEEDQEEEQDEEEQEEEEQEEEQEQDNEEYQERMERFKAPARLRINQRAPSSPPKESSGTIKGITKSKIKRSSRVPVDIPAHEEDDQKLARSSGRSYFPKRQDHDEMRNKHIEGGEMLDDFDDDDFSSDPDIKSTKNHMEKKDSMHTVQKAALEMAKLREMEEEKINRQNRGGF